MFVDYVPLMLINMASGLFILAFYLQIYSSTRSNKEWFSVFFIIGIVASLCGMHMIFTWPLFNMLHLPFHQLLG